MKDLNIIVKMKFGSHLYGTNTPESDMDYKGVFLPSKKEIFLNRVPKCYSSSTKKGSSTKNSMEDVDVEIYSLHYFIKLACEGQTVALDMLHAPFNMLIEKSPIWFDILNYRSYFHTKNLKAFIGYARRQAAKYGIKGSRLNQARLVVEVLKQVNPESKLRAIWGCLPVGEHCYMVEPNPDGISQYQVCGKIFQETALVGYMLDIMARFADNYGERAKKAANNIGIDWKAISHALRAAYQVRQLFTENTIKFPLKEAPLLKQVKAGKLDYVTEVSPLLEDLMEEVEELSAKSKLPEKANYKFWDKWLMETIESNL